MRTALIILGAISLAAGCSTAFADVIQGCPSNVLVTSSLVFDCEGNVFDFGHDLLQNPINPLPLGGSVLLKSATYITDAYGNPLWDLDFSFPTPAARTTEIDFSLFGPPIDGVRNGVLLLTLGLDAFPLFQRTPNESGSNFVVTETATDSFGNQVTFSMNGSDRGQLSPNPHALNITTTITDNAGDLTGFDAGFEVPEPGNWILLLGGLFCIYRVGRRPPNRRAQ